MILHVFGEPVHVADDIADGVIPGECSGRRRCTETAVDGTEE